MIKRLAVLLVILLIAVTGVFAAAFTLSGKYVLMDYTKTPIRASETEIGEYGAILVTGRNSPAKAVTDKVDITAGLETTLSLLDKDNKLIIYNVYGETTVSTSDAVGLKIYTPVSLIDGEVSGEIFIRSTNDEEVMLNLSDNQVIVYDAVRGKYTSVAPMRGYNYLKSKLIAVPAGAGKEDIKNYPAVPEAPTFVTTQPSVSVEEI